MTDEEAIDLLDNLIGMITDNHDSDYDTALKIGIKAIKQRKKPECQCHCYCQYPNKHHKHANGKWKCVDKYRPIDKVRRNSQSPLTYCKRIDAESEDTESFDDFWETHNPSGGDFPPMTESEVEE